MTLRCACVASIVFAASLDQLALPAVAGIMSVQQVVIDFTKSEKVRSQAIWRAVDAVKLGERGLGWDGEKRSSYDFWIQTTEPIPLGTSWRPTSAVQMTARIIPPGEFVFGENSVQFPHGEMYVRYSPDAKHWSTWQNLPVQTPKDKEHPQQSFSGSVRVPYREREEYQKLVMQYSRMDVPWGSDEEAAVKWILADDPDFLERSLPFIGYVQFLFETSLRGGDRIERIEFDLHWSVGGVHMLPKEGADSNERQGPWRFRADDSPQQTVSPSSEDD